MNKYPLCLRDRLRFRYGLKWAGVFPSMRELGITRNEVMAILIMVFAYGWAMTAAYADEAATDVEFLGWKISAAQQRAKDAEKLLLDCMNGKAAWTAPGPHKDGHAVTWIQCQKARELAL